ncbi:phosphatidate cytidylyltransferase [Epibacterium sp. Ofav1-8]|uniref:phosphatidate cytidylyltransferase n=1 Tax=Epibacterium sp. Ofav1-8 TaxID=2917735 RepID=UPI001EF55DD7|nr:phosphatidate cytidylyltransferase [Epibacterium sp. Ofav1-8]MCG7623302.1 phosphatidate cytidylyltransferase [Epibacterium sp. Ofav1-8]
MSARSPFAQTPGRWADLRTRSLSAAVLLGLGGGSLAIGGLAFLVFVAACLGAVFWELLRMYRADLSLPALGCGLLAALAILLAAMLPLLLMPLVLAVPLAAGAWVLQSRRRYFLMIAGWVLLGGFGLIWLRDAYGFGWMLWLILVVVATDVAGYFAGKHFGGPKFWPAVSPKKTWSGTAGGWVAAAVIGVLFAWLGGLPASVIPLSVVVSMASQAGDIAESALKRYLGVKDSSQLIPGHGGVFDRFDGMLGAGALCFVVAMVLS